METESAQRYSTHSTELQFQEPPEGQQNGLPALPPCPHTLPQDPHASLVFSLAQKNLSGQYAQHTPESLPREALHAASSPSTQIGTHFPSRQPLPPGHSLKQAPQCLASVPMFTHSSPHLVAVQTGGEGGGSGAGGWVGLTGGRVAWFCGGKK